MAALLLLGCSETKYVAEGDYLLDHVKVKTDSKNSLVKTEEMKAFVRQRGNSRWFSTVKVPLQKAERFRPTMREPQKRALAGVGRPMKPKACRSSRLNFARRKAENAAMMKARKGMNGQWIWNVHI